MIEDIDYPSEATLAAWSNCAIAGCPNKCCRAKNSIYCWPHTGSGKNTKEFMKDFKKQEPKEVVEI